MQSINRNRPSQEVRQQLDLSQIIARKQEDVATGKKLRMPSDDPTAWLEISVLATQQSNEAAWTSNIGRAKTRSSAAEIGLSSISNGLIKTKELLIQANGGTANAANRETIAIELEGIFASMSDTLTLSDSYGGDVFQNGEPIEIPIGNNVRVVSAPSLQTVTDNIGVGGGATSTLQAIMTDIISAVRSGTTAGRQNMFEPLRLTEDHINNLVAGQGIVDSRLEMANSQFTTNAVTLAERRSAIEDTNLPETISRIQSLLVNLQAAQATYAQIEQRSLFDLLR